MTLRKYVLKWTVNLKILELIQEFEKAEIMDEIILNWSGYTEEEKKKLSSLIRTKMDDDIIVNLMEKTSNLASETEQLKETIRRMDLSLLCLKGEVRRFI